MGLFKRSDRSAERIAGFWSWWSGEGRTAAEAAIRGADAEAFAARIGREVARIGTLDWQLSPGETAEHVLVVSAGGDPERLSLARRVVLAAPAPDGVWSYADTRPPAPDPEDLSISLAERTLALGQVSVSARLSGLRFDVVVHHPAYPDLPEEARAQATFLALDAALGEVDTELWVGEVVSSEVSPLDGFGLRALRAVVQDHRDRHRDADGRPTWVPLRAETPGGTVVVDARVPLSPLVAPQLDTYLAVVVPYADRDSEGLPADGSAEMLDRLHLELAHALGHEGLVVAQQSAAGVHTLHAYAAVTPELMSAVKRVAQTWPQGVASVHDQHDPGWDAVRHLRP